MTVPLKVSDHPQKMRTIARGRRTLVKLGPKSTTPGCVLPLPPVPLLLHVVALFPTALAILAVVDEDEEVVGFPPTSIVDKKEVVDKLEPHLRLQMDTHISSPEANVARLHNRFHRGIYLESPTHVIRVRTIPS